MLWPNYEQELKLELQLCFFHCFQYLLCCLLVFACLNAMPVFMAIGAWRRFLTSLLLLWFTLLYSFLPHLLHNALLPFHFILCPSFWIIGGRVVHHGCVDRSLFLAFIYFHTCCTSSCLNIFLNLVYPLWSNFILVRSKTSICCWPTHFSTQCIISKLVGCRNTKHKFQVIRGFHWSLWLLPLTIF